VPNLVEPARHAVLSSDVLTQVTSPSESIDNDAPGVCVQERRGASHTYRLILKGISTAIASKGIAVATTFFAVPLTVHYLGAERYGVWVTLTSILAYLGIFDLGIGSTATNHITDALANNDFESASNRINAAYFALACISVVMGLLVAVCWPAIDWPALLGVRHPQNGATEITVAAAVAIAVSLIGFPLSVTPRVMGACQKVVLSNYWASAGSGLNLLFIIIATRSRVGLPGLVFSYTGAGLTVGLLSTIWLYRKFDWLVPNFTHIKWQDIKALLSTGLPFFAVQLSGIILFQTDNIIIAQILGASAVTPYSITWRLFSYASLLPVMALPALWPAYADAFSRRDYAWIRKTYRYNVTIAVGSTSAFVLVLLFVARKFISIWAGPAAVPAFSLVALMACWTVISALSWSESCLLGAAGRVKGQAIYSGIGAVVNLIASVWLGRLFGLNGIIMGTLIAYLCCIVVPQTIEVINLVHEDRVQ